VGNPHAGFDEAGAGNGLLGTAPAFDPTLGGEGTEKSHIFHQPVPLARHYLSISYFPLLISIFFKICLNPSGEIQ